MRLAGLATVILSTVALASAWVPPPQPGASAVNHNRLKQVTSQELEARANYPEYFSFDKSQEPSPTSTCAVVDQVLQPYEAVAFLIGRGQFESDNGTVYVDENHKALLKRRAERAERWGIDLQESLQRFRKNICLPSPLLITRIGKLPSFREICSGFRDKFTFVLNTLTSWSAFVGGREWTEIEVYGIQLPRRFFEAAAAF
ncbi:hypothetical protein DFP72DRAFT_1061908 [Ephemerocybe angulata]|uniref:Uncharacterized protein n=1 Tax=Ephemerocybe angulata TaxID=980116 RepID=A0A8H6IA12_9AGAR|nr:hypothetical protein DFP72DRAFT_1061908 [Tulosesus angulatus]